MFNDDNWSPPVLFLLFYHPWDPVSFILFTCPNHHLSLLISIMLLKLSVHKFLQMSLFLNLSILVFCTIVVRNFISLACTLLHLLICYINDYHLLCRVSENLLEVQLSGCVCIYFFFLVIGSYVML